ncbi:hypothetical protein [Leucobacter sp. gxy201]|uniref:hypothetical protein n=1 Tax=Leucobacter sp. gxy201 TaxID=2957200 RepID=UPI003DA0F400
MTAMRGSRNSSAHTELPLLDEHRTGAAAPPAAVWASLLACVGGFDNGAARAYASAVRARPRFADGRFPEQGSAVPGFAVSHIDRPRALVLSGRHLLSEYAMVILVDADVDDRVTVRIRSHATFAGLQGALYRLAVFGTGMHRILLKRLLRTIARGVIPS